MVVSSMNNLGVEKSLHRLTTSNYMEEALDVQHFHLFSYLHSTLQCRILFFEVGVAKEMTKHKMTIILLQ